MLTLIHSSSVRPFANTAAAAPPMAIRHSPLAAKANLLAMKDPRAARVIEELIVPAIERAAGVPASQPIAPSSETERFTIAFDRLASGAKRTFWISKAGARIHDHYDVPTASWTRADIDRICDHLAEELRAHLGRSDAPVEFQCGTQGAHNWNHRRRDPSTGPRRCRYLSLCAVSGRMRAEMGIGNDVALPEHVRSFLLDQLPRCAASWE